MMILSKEAEQIGTNSGQLEIKGSGTHTIVRLNSDVHRELAAMLANASAKPPCDRVYLRLENIKGSRDATVLNVYINLPEDAVQNYDSRLLAGSIGLYGLRRASIQHGAGTGLGLTFVLDITRMFREPSAAKSPSANEIRVSIVPERQLLERADIVVGRVSIFRQRHLV